MELDNSKQPTDGYRSARHNPWWIPRFMGGLPRGIDAGHLRILGFVTLSMFFENYDLSTLGHALPQIADSFGVDTADLGLFTGLTRLGALPAFFILPFADRIGRRRLVLLSVAGLCAGALLTAVSQSATQFVIAQVMMRSFIIAAMVTSFVMVSEEFPAAHRGWGIGILAGVGAIGFGVGALVYGLVQWLPFGWRSLYVIGAAPLLFLPMMARGMRETARFVAAKGTANPSESSRSSLDALRSIVALFRQHRRRALAIALTGALMNFGIGPAFQFLSQFLQDERGWTPGQFAGFSLGFGVLAIMGNPIAGRLGDRYGRRIVAAIVLAAFPLVTIVFYLGPPWLVVLAWPLMVFLAMASIVCIRALATEVFPTTYRSTGAGTHALLETVGTGVGLLVCSWLISLLGSQAIALSVVSLSCLAAVGAVFFLPETARRELEDVSDTPVP